MTQTIILAHYINTTGKSRAEAIEEYHSEKRRFEILNAQWNQHSNDKIMTYVVLTDDKPTSIECVYPVTAVVDDDDYINLVKRLDNIVELQTRLFSDIRMTNLQE